MAGPSIPFAHVVVHIIMLQRGVRNCALCVREQVDQDQLETSTQSNRANSGRDFMIIIVGSSDRSVGGMTKRLLL